MDKLLTLQYYFAVRPSPDFNFTKITLAIGLLFFIGGIALNFYRKKYLQQNKILKKILRAYPGLLQTYGLIILALLLIREVGIPYLSMRIWWIVLIAFIIYSITQFLLKFKKKYHSLTIKAQKRTKQNKYLPKKKKRRKSYNVNR